MAPRNQAPGATWRQLDRHLTVRIVLPWVPVFIGWQAGNEAALAPELFGALAVVLALHNFTEGSPYNKGMGILGVSFIGVPLILGSVVCAGGSRRAWAFAIVAYVAAGLGTVLSALSDLRGRR
jgi:hypothetical protein